MLYVGEGSKREQYHLLSSHLAFSHFPRYPQLNWALLALIPGWVGRPCVHSRILWVSPTNCHMRMGVSLAASTPTGFFSQTCWGFISQCWNPGLCGLSHSPDVPPGLSAHKCGTALSASCHLTESAFHPNAHLHPSYQPGWMFLLQLLGCQTSIQFDFLSVLVVFVFIFVVVLLLVVWGGTVCLPMPPSWLEVHIVNILKESCSFILFSAAEKYNSTNHIFKKPAI